MFYILFLFYLGYGLPNYFNEDDDDNDEFFPVEEYSDEDDGDDLSGFVAEEHGFNDDISLMTGFKSVAFRESSGHHSASSRKQISSILKKKQVPVYNSILAPEYILDTWKDQIPNNRCTIQFRLPSGRDAATETKVRVSTNGMFLVLTRQMSDIALNATKGVISTIRKRNPSINLKDKVQKELFNNHSRIIGRRSTVSNICHRDISSPNVPLESRIPLPFKCRSQVTTEKDGDSIFYGQSYFIFPDGSLWCTVELISDTTGEYRALDKLSDIHIHDVENQSVFTSNQNTGHRTSQVFRSSYGHGKKTPEEATDMSYEQRDQDLPSLSSILGKRNQDVKMTPTEIVINTAESVSTNFLQGNINHNTSLYMTPSQQEKKKISQKVRSAQRDSEKPKHMSDDMSAANSVFSRSSKNLKLDVKDWNGNETDNEL